MYINQYEKFSLKNDNIKNIQLEKHTFFNHTLKHGQQYIFDSLYMYNLKMEKNPTNIKSRLISRITNKSSKIRKLLNSTLIKTL
jgi:hypothetical protein